MTPIVLAVVGTAVVASLAVLLQRWDADNEQRLLEEQTAQAGVVLTVSINEFLEPVMSLAEVAEVTAEDGTVFDHMARRLMSRSNGAYTRLALVDLGTGEVLSERGDTTALQRAGRDLDPLLDGISGGELHVVDLLEIDRTLGFVAAGPGQRLAVYMERQLAPDPNQRRRDDGPFANIDYAIYLGDEPLGDRLLGSSSTELPFQGDVATIEVPYGDTSILLVTRPLDRLGNSLLAHLWWIALLVGGAMVALVALLLRGIEREREQALRVAAHNSRLHHEQREVAETFQLELLPRQLATPPGCRLTTRYWVADDASMIGGDFYDAFRIDDQRWGILIGDFCGKGVTAGALTGLARYTARAAARFIDAPADVLLAIHEALADHDPPTFCTAAFMVYRPDDPDGGVPGGTLTTALGGHPQPLLRRHDGSVVPVGLPGTLLGMIEPSIHDVSCRLEPGDTLLSFTDGLTDAPDGRALTDDDLRAALGEAADIEEIAANLRRRRGDRGGGGDDTALLLVQVDLSAECVDDSAGGGRPTAVGAEI